MFEIRSSNINIFLPQQYDKNGRIPSFIIRHSSFVIPKGGEK